MRRQTLNVCEAGHATHDYKQTDTAAGPFYVWDWQQYGGFAGYCPGQDDVSMSLDLYGEWETADWRKAMSVLQPGDRMWDFGSHIGWYAVPALARGADVWAVDADPENMRLLVYNTRGDGQLTYQTVWAAESEPPSWERIRLLKVDIEGGEIDALQVAWPWVERQQVDWMLVECSPEFDTYYPDLVDAIIDCGYTASYGGRTIGGSDLGGTQKNVWLRSRMLQSVTT